MPAAGDPARAGRAQYRARSRGRRDGCSRRFAGRQEAIGSGAARPARGSRDPRRASISGRGCGGPQGRRGGQARHVRRRADQARNGIWLHPPLGRPDGQRGVFPDRAVRREARPAPRRSATSSRASTTGTAACSCSAPRSCSRSCASWRPRSTTPARAGVHRREARSGFHAPARERVRRVPERFVRLCGHGKDAARRGGAARCGLERRRLLVRAARSDPRRRARQRAHWRRADRRQRGLLPAVDEPAGRCRRARGSRGSRDQGRRAGRAEEPRAGREGAGRAIEEAGALRDARCIAKCFVRGAATTASTTASASR